MGGEIPSDWGLALVMLAFVGVVFVGAFLRYVILPRLWPRKVS
jgi:TRAP-type C4-dicarboxylate transport system permease small subunit